jgi:heterodisulfide reductase subunit C
MESELRSSHVTIQREGQGASVELDPRFTEEIAALVGGLDLAHCFQCGVCSGSCPTMARMTYGPRKIMHMIHLGLADRVLRSQDIWYCVSCFSCAARCPQGIEIADVMSALRNMAVAKGLARDKEATFSQIFIKVLQEHGRMYEPEVLLRYYASVRDLDAMVKIAPLGLRMFLKRKIGLVPQRIENATELADIAARINGRGGE